MPNDCMQILEPASVGDRPCEASAANVLDMSIIPLCHFDFCNSTIFQLDFFHIYMSTLSTTVSTSLSRASRSSKRALRYDEGSFSAIGRIHTGVACRQEPRQKDEPWAMPSPEAGPSRLPHDASSNASSSSTSPDVSPPTSSSPKTPSSSSAIPTFMSSTSSPAKLSNKCPNRLTQWIPPHWQTHLQPDAQWRKAIVSRKKRIAEQAGQQLTGLGLKLNEVTGYKEVERLKELVGEKGDSLIHQMRTKLT